MKKATKNASPNQSRGRIAFWNVFACMFAGLAAFTLIRGGQDLIANIACGVLATFSLLCLLARLSIQYPERMGWTFYVRHRQLKEHNDEDCTQAQSSIFNDERRRRNPATGLTMLGASDSAGNPYGVDLESERWHRGEP